MNFKEHVRVNNTGRTVVRQLKIIGTAAKKRVRYKIIHLNPRHLKLLEGKNRGN